MQLLSKKKTNLLTNKIADTVIAVIIILPTILLLTFYLAGSLGSRAIMQRRIQNAIDIILLDVSQSTNAVDIFYDNTYKTVCALDSSKEAEQVDYYKNEIVSKINGYNDEWILTITYIEDPDIKSSTTFSVYTMVKVEIKAVFPKGIITNYSSWYKKNITFSSSSSTALFSTISGIAECR